MLALFMEEMIWFRCDGLFEFGYADDLDGRKSLTGYVYILVGFAILDGFFTVFICIISHGGRIYDTDKNN